MGHGFTGEAWKRVKLTGPCIYFCLDTDVEHTLTARDVIANQSICHFKVKIIHKLLKIKPWKLSIIKNKGHQTV